MQFYGWTSIKIMDITVGKTTDVMNIHSYRYPQVKNRGCWYPRTRKKMTLSKLQILDDNFCMVTFTKIIVMVTKNSNGYKNWLLFQQIRLRSLYRYKARLSLSQIFVTVLRQSLLCVSLLISKVNLWLSIGFFWIFPAKLCWKILGLWMSRDIHSWTLRPGPAWNTNFSLRFLPSEPRLFGLRWNTGGGVFHLPIISRGKASCNVLVNLFDSCQLTQPWERQSCVEFFRWKARLWVQAQAQQVTTLIRRAGCGSGSGRGSGRRPRSGAARGRAVANKANSWFQFEKIISNIGACFVMRFCESIQSQSEIHGVAQFTIVG